MVEALLLIQLKATIGQMLTSELGQNVLEWKLKGGNEIAMDIMN